MSDKNGSLIKELETAQDMIKHYDDLNMRFGAWAQTGVFILIGLSFGLLARDKQMFLYLFPVVIFMVVVLHILVHYWLKRHRHFSKLKIKRILEIEKALGWKQFTVVDEAIKSEKGKTIPIGRILVAYHIILPISLIAAYFLVLFSNP